MNAPLSERPLPDFKAPPVIEVALGVQFEPHLAFTTASFHRLWGLYKDRFPKTQDQVPLPPIIESQDALTQPIATFGWFAQPPLPRWWFLNESQTELLQIQDDRFIRNWRRVRSGDEYPRYEQIHDGFQVDFRALAEFALNEHLGEIRPTQCEITYVNHIHAGGGWERHGAIDPVIKWWRPADRSSFLGEPEDVRVAARYVLRDDASAFLGRLTVDLQPALLSIDGTPILVLTLTARGRPEGPGLEGVMKFLERGREWIVRGFAEITTEAMQTQVWKRVR